MIRQKVRLTQVIEHTNEDRQLLHAHSAHLAIHAST